MKSGKNINLRLVELSDAEFIVNLRSSKGTFLSKTSSQVEQQIKWIENYKIRENKKEEFYFIIESKEKENLGVIRLYDFQGDSFCWGSWIVKDGAPVTTAIESVLLIYEIGFYKLGFKRTHFDVRKANQKVLNFHKRFGVKKVGETELDYLFNMDIEEYEINKKKYSKFF